MLDRLPRPPLIWPAVAQMSKLGPVALTTTPGALADVIDHSWPRSGAEDLVQNDSAPAVRTLSSDVKLYYPLATSPALNRPNCPQSNCPQSTSAEDHAVRTAECRGQPAPIACGSSCSSEIAAMFRLPAVSVEPGLNHANNAGALLAALRFTSVYFGLLRFTLAPSETECGSRLH